MLGAIVGDVIGSVYEWRNHKSKSFPLFRDDCFFTDDTVLTVATAQAILAGGEEGDFTRAYKQMGAIYPHLDYGENFRLWLHSFHSKPYNSYGNGSAMRVSPCGWVAPINDPNGLALTQELARRSAVVTHNHPEGIRGAQAVADTIYLCRCHHGDIPACKAEVMGHVMATYGYDLNNTLDEIRPSYPCDESCQGTVPEAIVAFLESDSFEDAVRGAISLGGDSDTLAAIAGSIAEAAYGVPVDIRDKALSYLDERLLGVYHSWRERYSA